MERGGFSLNYPAGWHTQQMSQTLTLAETREALEADAAGENLVILIDSTPISTLSEQHGDEAVASVEDMFQLSKSGPEQLGYTLVTSETMSVDDRPGVVADMQANGSAGRLAVISTPPHVLRVFGYAAPDVWAAQQQIFDEIVGSMTFFPPTALSTPTPEITAAQPAITTEGPPGFVQRLGSNEGPMEGRFVSTRGLDAAPDGTLYVAESNRGVWVFDSEGTLEMTFGEDVLLDAYDVALGKSGNLFVADYGQNAIVRFRTDGTLVESWGEVGDQPEQFGLLSPQRIAVGPDGSVYALDSRTSTEGSISSVVRFQPNGDFLERVDLAEGLSPNDLAVDQEGNIYLADSFSGAVIKVNAQGEILARFGVSVSDEGITAGAIDLDGQGNLYVATWNNGVLKFALDGTLLLSAGEVAEPGTIPQPGQFSLPNGIAVAPGEIVWVSDNDGEYSAITALQLFEPEDVQATTEAIAAAQTAEAIGETPTPTPIPEELLVGQWATDAEASSHYGDDYAPDGATGPPDVEGCRSSENAWAAASPDTVETLELTYDTPVLANRINIYQSHQPGAISEVEVRDEQGDYTTVYTATAELWDDCPAVLQVYFDTTGTPVDGVRLTIDQQEPSTWSEIDAVELVGLE
jgi:sugar lactone lactonase YvrE